MRSLASLLLAAPLLVAAQAPEPSTPSALRATAGDGEAAAYDAVGYASIGTGAAMTGAHARLPLGSIAEVTALDSGRIILVRVTARQSQDVDSEIALSRGAAQSLGLSGEMDAVRVRSVRASAADLAALSAGGSVSPRLPAPEELLRALRRMLPALPAGDGVASVQRGSRRAALTSVARQTAPAAARKSPKQVGAAEQAATGRPRSVARGGLLVQVAALRDEQRARSVARELRGRVERVAGLWRVRLGPFADRASAQRARDAAISRGYDGASIISAPE